LPVLQAQDGRRVPRRCRLLGVRAQAPGGSRRADRAQPYLAPRPVGAREGPVRDSHVGRDHRGDLPARLERARRAPPSPGFLVLQAPAVNVDETGWATAGKGRTLWTATTATAAIFRIAQDRHRDRLQELLGDEFAGICCSDRWWAYNHIDPSNRQACWSHLQRDFRFHAEGLPAQKLFGEQCLKLTSRLFHAWHGFHEHQDRTRLANEIAPIQTELRALVEEAGPKTPKNKYHRGFANNLLKIWPALWTFVTNESVEPTNNAAERSLRGPVIHRKLSHGTRTQDGERLTERALSASVTCRLQHRSLYNYLIDLFTAHARGDPLPALT